MRRFALALALLAIVVAVVGGSPSGSGLFAGSVAVAASPVPCPTSFAAFPTPASNQLPALAQIQNAVNAGTQFGTLAMNGPIPGYTPGVISNKLCWVPNRSVVVAAIKNNGACPQNSPTPPPGYDSMLTWSQLKACAIWGTVASFNFPASVAAGASYSITSPSNTIAPVSNSNIIPPGNGLSWYFPSGAGGGNCTLTITRPDSVVAVNVAVSGANGSYAATYAPPGAYTFKITADASVPCTLTVAGYNSGVSFYV